MDISIAPIPLFEVENGHIYGENHLYLDLSTVSDTVDCYIIVGLYDNRLTIIGMILHWWYSYHRSYALNRSTRTISFKP